MFQNFFRKKKKSIKNEFELVEQSIQNTNRASDPIRPFSVEEISFATSDFRQEIHKDRYYTIYEGTHRDRKIYAKKFVLISFGKKDDLIEQIAIEVDVALRMRNHPNVLKLLGYCLKTDLPLLIYEFPENGNLYKSLFDKQAEKLSWDQKLKIAIETANSIAYLHHGLTNTFVHRDICPGNIFLDRNLSPRLFGFELAVKIPEGDSETEEDILAGRVGYMDPEVLFTGRYTSKSDVYGFGALLFEVLTEKRIYELRNFHPETSTSFESPRSKNQLLDEFVKETVEERCKDYLEDERIRVQVIEYTKLVKRCLRSNSGDRPDKIEAEMELRRIKTL